MQIRQMRAARERKVCVAAWANMWQVYISRFASIKNESIMSGGKVTTITQEDRRCWFLSQQRIDAAKLSLSNSNSLKHSPGHRKGMNFNIFYPIILLRLSGRDCIICGFNLTRFWWCERRLAFLH